MDAMRNLLEEIKGSELLSLLTAKDGILKSDKIINNVRGRIKFVKIISQKYNSKTGSSEVYIGITKENLEKNIKLWH